MNDIIKSLRVLGITADTLFERIKEDLERGLDDDARRHLDFVDLVLKKEVAE